MKEITRIHIAKVSYDIETTAKRELEKYINKLELYAADDELLQDIEIRITELFAERGIVKDGVITGDDVAAVRKQLGEPQDFLGDSGDIAVGSEGLDGETTRKLYRDKDAAVLGGVLSGIARFFRIDPIWIRLIFIILLFASFGTVTLIYVVAWIAIAPARTAAEKLRMNGQPVTLGSIRELNEDEDRQILQHQRASIVRRVVVLCAGTLSAIAAAGSLFVTIWGSIFIFKFGYTEDFKGISLNEPLYLVATIAIIISGVLLMTLFSIFAYAAFTNSYSRRLVVATIIVVIAGVVSAATAGSTVAYQGWQTSEQLQRDTVTKTVRLADTFSAVKQLKVNTQGDRLSVRVEYIVSDTPRYELTSLPGVVPNVAIDGETAVLTIDTVGKDRSFFGSPMLKVYGPSLNQVTVESGSVSYSTTRPQGEMTVVSQSSDGSVELYGSYKRVVTEGGSIALGGSSIESLEARMGVYGAVEAGTVRHLAVVQPDVCPAGDNGYNELPQVIVRAVTSGEMTYNTQLITAKTHKTSCGVVTIGNRDAYNQEYDD